MWTSTRDGIKQHSAVGPVLPARETKEGVNVIQAGETGPTLSDNEVPYHASNGIEDSAVAVQSVKPARDYLVFFVAQFVSQHV